MDQPVHTCKNCGHSFTGKYCNNCGEKVYTKHDKSILHFFEDAFHFITHFEGTFFNTLKAIFTRPGKLSLDYCNGLRKKYFRPLSFFMLLVILYLIFPFFTGLNMPFKFYLDEGKFERQLVSRKTGVDIDSLRNQVNIVLSKRDFQNREQAYRAGSIYVDSVIKTIPSLSRLEARYDKKSEKISKLLLLILLPLTALALWLFSLRKKQVFFDHLTLATEINAAFLLFNFFILPLFVILFQKITPSLVATYLSDIAITGFGYLVLFTYAAIAIWRFYAEKWWWAILKAGLLTVAHFYMVGFIYRKVLFLINLYFSG